MTTRLETTRMNDTFPSWRRLRAAVRQVPAFVLLVLAVLAVATEQFSASALVVIALAGLVAAIVAESGRPWHPRPQLATPGAREPWLSPEPSTRVDEQRGHPHAD